MWLTKLISGDNGRPGSAIDGTAKGLAQFSQRAGEDTLQQRPVLVVAHLLNYELHNEGHYDLNPSGRAI